MRPALPLLALALAACAPDASKVDAEIRKFAAEYIATTDVPKSTAMLDELASGTPSEDAIAKTVSMSTRSLQRRLAAEGTSYTQLLAMVRKELAEVIAGEKSRQFLRADVGIDGHRRLQPLAPCNDASPVNRPRFRPDWPLDRPGGDAYIPHIFLSSLMT